MFWSGIIIGIFIGSALGVLVMSMAISAANNTEARYQHRTAYDMEASEELSPDLENKEDDIEHTSQS
ncbi:MAG: hypothetical protein GX308_04270 [Epulopiscium sp.]|nr:hypothetical protein [Candidatus Epulonipiscium sp.]